MKSILEKWKRFTLIRLMVILTKKIMELKILFIYAPLSPFFLDKYEMYNKNTPKTYNMQTMTNEKIFKSLLSICIITKKFSVKF